MLSSPYIPTAFPPLADSAFIVPALVRLVFPANTPIIFPVPFKSMFEADVRLTDEFASASTLFV